MLKAVPKPVYSKARKKRFINKYRKRKVAVSHGGLYAKPPEYDKKQDEINAKLAASRDNGLCQWCLIVLGKKVIGSTPHHIRGRRRAYGVDNQITLCYTHHDCFHKALPDESGNRITIEKLEELIRYINEKV